MRLPAVPGSMRGVVGLRVMGGSVEGQLCRLHVAVVELSGVAKTGLVGACKLPIRACALSPLKVRI